MTTHGNAEASQGTGYNKDSPITGSRLEDTTMSVKKALDELLATFADEQLQEVLDFARLVNARQERQQWQRFGARQLARAYGPDEPGYTEADLKPELNP
jgi:hypothetical protein